VGWPPQKETGRDPPPSRIGIGRLRIKRKVDYDGRGGDDGP